MNCKADIVISAHPYLTPMPDLAPDPNLDENINARR